MIRSRIKDYRLMRRLGSGGLGTVYEAIHEHQGNKVAIKVLSSNHSSPAYLRLILSEQAALTQLAAVPGIVRTHEWGQLPTGAPYLVMELVEGTSLADRLRAQGALAPRAAVSIIRQLAISCALAHEKGIIHRDLKPSNVILRPDVEGAGVERTVLLDFDIAKVPLLEKWSDETARSGEVLGTVKYMSPEQCQSIKSAGPLSDVYSLGVLFYELLTGKLPHQMESATTIQRLVARLNEDPTPVYQHKPDIPKRLGSFVHKMLSEHPMDRPTMAQIVQEMDELLASENLEVPPKRELSVPPPIAEPADPHGAVRSALRKQVVLVWALLIALAVALSVTALAQ